MFPSVKMLKQMQFSKLELNTLPSPFPATVPDGSLSYTSDISQGLLLLPPVPAIIKILSGLQYKQPPGWIWGNAKGQRAKHEARDDPGTDGK